MTADEVEEVHDVAQSGRLAEWRDAGEKWFTFEHAGQWREIVRQFLGAVQSHGMLRYRIYAVSASRGEAISA